FEASCDAIKSSYAIGTTDEFIEPVRRAHYEGMRDGDGILCANFRADRVRELLSAILEPAFDGFERSRTVSLAAALGMVTYSDRLAEICETIFPPAPITNTLGEVIARSGRRQLRAAETEKYPHVTYFFNGGEETPNDGEERLLVPSPKVATYDLQPEMSAPELTERLAEKLRSNAYDVFIINYANGDMVGHTGDLNAAKKAVETVDASIGVLEEALLEVGGTMLIIADHGNCETMFDRDAGVPHTAHTLNPVPAVLINCKRKGVAVRNGRLADVAPTILELMGLAQPTDMTGASLLIATRA
ncbi:MAG: 2,3-bisphosphoglycerate-independent phosphoglycerate mutase, partial [Pseudomonadota bacterium]